MKSTDKHIHLFDPSGCINEGAFFSYLNQALNPSDMHAIENHLSECIFCSDALEGYEMQADKTKVQVDLLTIKKEFFLKLNGQQAFIKKDNKRYLVLAVSIAASFFLIISGYYIFQLLPTNLKQSDLALQMPVQKNDIPEVQNHLVPKSENNQEEKSGSKDKGDINTVSQSEFKPEFEKNTKSAQDNKYFQNREGWLQTDGDGITTTKASGKSAEYITPVSGETIKTMEQTGGKAVVVTEDAEYLGKIDDITMALDQRNELKKETGPVEAKAKMDEVVSVNNVLAEEKIVSGKKEKQADRNKNEKPGVTVTGGVMRSALTPTLNSAMADYNSGNYSQAMPQFEYLLTQDKNNYAASYYLAICLYNKGAKDSALIQLEKLIRKKNNPFYEMALWQKAQIIEESNDKKQAAEIYREIIKNNGSMKTRAIKKVDELEK